MDNTQNADAPRFSGESINAGDRTLIVPPLSLRQVQQFLVPLQQLREMPSLTAPENIDTMLDVATAAIQRNYPDMTRDQVAEVLDLKNIGPTFRAIMGRVAFDGPAMPVAE